MPYDRAGNESVPLWRQGKLLVIFAVTLMGVMAVALISPAFPAIMDHFQISKAKIGWLVTAFTLPGIFLVLLIGSLADRIGRKQVLVPCLFLFGSAGAASAFAPDFQTLLILRFLQGIGGGGLIMLAVTLIGDYYEGVQRAEAMGANAVVLSIGTASYPFLGGLLGEISWSAPFLLFLTAIPVGVASLLILKNPSTQATSLKSYLGKISSFLSEGKTIAAMLASLLSFALLYGGIITYFVVMLSVKFGASPATIGALVSAMFVVVAITASQAGRLVKRFSKVPLILAGFAGYGSGLLLMPLIPSIWLFLIPLGIFGVGHGLGLPNLQTYVLELAPTGHRGMAMSVYTSSARTGMTVGPVAFASVLGLGGLDVVFIFGGFLGLFASIAGALIVYLR